MESNIISIYANCGEYPIFQETPLKYHLSEMNLHKCFNSLNIHLNNFLPWSLHFNCYVTAVFLFLCFKIHKLNLSEIFNRCFFHHYHWLDYVSSVILLFQLVLISSQISFENLNFKTAIQISITMVHKPKSIYHQSKEIIIRI